MRVECEGRAAAWLVGTLAVPSVQGHGLPLLQELWPYQSLWCFHTNLKIICSGSEENAIGNLIGIALNL